ncbi:hypothetical protein [Phreatobacter stygius]|uniref:Uncharacterized protein n=1 Tax=Phreatobacter stygius TaxID=1940610 RepID=A0A4D7B5J6_9HYPH|nr:hypothetical protein [Phreatobacter stygius]QCI64986.1 hypothetical protein E8M01_12585 [Phreatobacter stygius]
MTDDTSRTIPITGLVFVLVMLVAGLALALLLKAYPGLGETVPGLMWLLVAALVFDVAVNALATRGVAQALTMPWRVGGFCAGAVVQHFTSTYAL